MPTQTEKRQAGKVKRKHNRGFSAYLLEKAGVPFEIRNEGAHLIVGNGDMVFDFFPGTGLFKLRSFNETHIEGRGIYYLLEFLKEKNDHD